MAYEYRDLLSSRASRVIGLFPRPKPHGTCQGASENASRFFREFFLIRSYLGIISWKEVQSHRIPERTFDFKPPYRVGASPVSLHTKLNYAEERPPIPTRVARARA
jgi:hypothetical protein